MSELSAYLGPEPIAFVVFAGVALGAAIAVIAMRNLVHAALMLVIHLLAVAGLYLTLESQFLAVVQVLVYAGAIVVLFLFVIMLLGVDTSENLSVEPLRIQRPLAAVIGAGFVILVGAAVVRTRATIAQGPELEASGDSNIRLLARNLFSDQVLAFELTSVLLIVAVAGTVLLTRRQRRREDGDPAAW